MQILQDNWFGASTSDKNEQKMQLCTNIHWDNTEDSLFFNLLKISWLWYQVLLKYGSLWRQSVNNLLWISLQGQRTQRKPGASTAPGKTLIPHSSKWEKTNTATTNPQKPMNVWQSEVHMSFSKCINISWGKWRIQSQALIRGASDVPRGNEHMSKHREVHLRIKKGRGKKPK